MPVGIFYPSVHNRCSHIKEPLQKKPKPEKVWGDHKSGRCYTEVSVGLTESTMNSAGNMSGNPGSTAHSHAGSLASKQSQSQLMGQTGNPQVSETAVFSNRYTGSSGIWAPCKDCVGWRSNDDSGRWVYRYLVQRF